MFNRLVEHYFNLGKTYQEIVETLEINHGIKTSLKSVKRFLRDQGLTRYNQYPQTYVNEVVRYTLQGPGSLLGYRLLRQRIKVEHGITIPREQIRLALLSIDPEGVQLRQQRRLLRRTYHVDMPSKKFHMDGYDKLKPYGFSIYATIDGYSRFIPQLCVMVSNKEPNQVGHAFLDGIMENGGFPQKTISDYGTETVVVAGIMETIVGSDSHTYTSSQRNQRIESWWSQLRKGSTTYMMNLFALLESEGLVNYGDPYHKDLIRYSFMPSIQTELETFRRMWNLHNIRSQRYNDVPSGVPSDLHFNSPVDAKIVIPVDILENIRNSLPPRNTSRTGDWNKDKSLFDICCQFGLDMNPKTLLESSELFLKLKNIGRIF